MIYIRILRRATASSRHEPGWTRVAANEEQKAGHSPPSRKMTGYHDMARQRALIHTHHVALGASVFPTRFVTSELCKLVGIQTGPLLAHWLSACRAKGVGAGVSFPEPNPGSALAKPLPEWGVVNSAQSCTVTLIRPRESI
jgi:hypothetical protein